MVAGFLNSFIRHADVVKIANIAQIVNVIAPVMTRGDELLIQSIFYPFEMFSKRREGVSLWPIINGPRYESASHGEVNYVDSSAILGDDLLHVFLTNRHLSENGTVKINLVDRAIVSLSSAELLTGPAPQAANSFEQPNLVVARPFADVQIADGQATLTMPPLSVVALTFKLG